MSQHARCLALHRESSPERHRAYRRCRLQPPGRRGLWSGNDILISFFDFILIQSRRKGSRIKSSSAAYQSLVEHDLQEFVEIHLQHRMAQVSALITTSLLRDTHYYLTHYYLATLITHLITDTHYYLARPWFPIDKTHSQSKKQIDARSSRV